MITRALNYLRRAWWILTQMWMSFIDWHNRLTFIQKQGYQQWCCQRECLALGTAKIHCLPGMRFGVCSCPRRPPSALVTSGAGAVLNHRVLSSKSALSHWHFLSYFWRKTGQKCNKRQWLFCIDAILKMMTHYSEGQSKINVKHLKEIRLLLRVWRIAIYESWSLNIDGFLSPCHQRLAKLERPIWCTGYIKWIPTWPRAWVLSNLFYWQHLNLVAQNKLLTTMWAFVQLLGAAIAVGDWGTCCFWAY